MQLLALEWIHDHIADFGGDPDRVTIMVNIIVFTIFVKTAIIVMSNLAKLASTFGKSTSRIFRSAKSIAQLASSIQK